MPISTSVPLRHLSQAEFGSIAYEVVRNAFQVYETLGPNFHESVYRSALKRVLGSRAIEEVQIKLTHRDYVKSLYLDLIVDGGGPFELKAVSTLTEAHQSQLIQYLMLTGLSHGKLINFGPSAVGQSFVNSHEPPEQRRKFNVERIDWPGNATTSWLEEVIVPLVQDWGTGLTKSLYLETVLAFAGGEERCRYFTDALWEQNTIGRQPIHAISDGVAVEISCLKQNHAHYERNLRKFISNTTLSSLLWANIDSGRVRLQRLRKP